ETAITRWSGAFGYGTRRTFKTLTRLLALTMTGPGGLDEGHTRPPDQVTDVTVRAVQTPAVTSESYLMGAARTRTMQSKCSQFSTASGLVSRWAFLHDSDPTARAEAALAGTVFTAEAINGHTLAVRGPFVAREGKQILLLPHQSIASRDTLKHAATVAAIDTARDGATTLILSEGTRLVLAPGQTHQFMAAPFMPSSTGRPGTRWTSPETAEKVPGRRVPLEIALAGAPTRMNRHD